MTRRTYMFTSRISSPHFHARASIGLITRRHCQGQGKAPLPAIYLTCLPLACRHIESGVEMSCIFRSYPFGPPRRRVAPAPRSLVPPPR